MTAGEPDAEKLAALGHERGFVAISTTVVEQGKT
jgi:hypothetical protein